MKSIISNGVAMAWQRHGGNGGSGGEAWRGVIVSDGVKHLGVTSVASASWQSIALPTYTIAPRRQ